MSGSDEDEAADSESVTVRESGIEVTKRFETERFPVPAVVFDIRSERDQPVGVRLTEQIPEGTAMDDIGFHPDFGSEFWTVGDHTLVLERAVLPDEDIETVYGLRGPDAENAAPFLDEPTIEVWSETEDGTLFDDAGDPLLRSASTEATSNADASEGAEDVAFHDEPGTDNSDESESDRSIRDGGNDGTESNDDENDATEADGSETTSAGTASESSMEETNMSDEPTTEIRTAEDEPETNEETAASEGATGGPSGGREETLAATLAAELRSGRVDEDDRETLSDVLGPRASLTARMERLRSQVDKVGAYTEALESFLDENGSAQQVLRRQTERTDALREEIETIDERTRSNRATLESVEEHTETIDDDLGAFRDAVADLDGIIEEIDDRQDRFEERLETIEEGLSANADRFETIEDRLETVTNRVETIETTHEEDMDEQRTRLKARMDDGLDDVEKQVDSVAADVESLQAWRSQLSAVLGGPDGANDDSTDNQ
jgi:archaellum component FlaC